MSDAQEPVSPPSSPGLLESFKALVLTFVCGLYTRFEIITNEIEEERERFEELILLGVACVFCVCMGVMLVSLLIIAFFWDSPYRMWVFGAVTLAYLAAGGGLALALRAKIRNKPRLFSTTLAELAKDRESLLGSRS